jgi:hypothetical protein
MVASRAEAEKTTAIVAMAAGVWSSGRLRPTLSSREAFWSRSTLLYFWGTKEAETQNGSTHWSSVREVSFCYNVLFRSILGYRSPVGDNLTPV